MKKYFGTVLAVIILLAMLEAVSRIILETVYNRSFDSSLIVDNKYQTSSGLKENATGYVWGKKFHTDQFGCRKSPVAYYAKKKKWLFIGDSVTEGVGVDDSSTFAAIVAQRIDSINIMNCSLIGYSDADYLNVIKTLLATKDSSIGKVTIFFCLNDVYGSAKTSQLPVMAKPNLLGLLNGWMQNNYATYKLVKLLVYATSNRYFKYDEQFYKTDDPYFTEAMQRLKECDSLCKSAGVSINVVMLPYKSQMDGRDGDVPQKMVRNFCAGQQIAFGSVPIGTIEISTAKPGNALYLFADEIHFSKAGHKMMADYILSH